MLSKVSFKLNHPFVQNFVCALVLFACPGLYGAITGTFDLWGFRAHALGLGAGGGKTTSTNLADITNTTLYAVYTMVGIFAGSFLNILGPRLALSVRRVPRLD